MPKKKEKIPELYQILDEDNKPVRIKIGYSSGIDNSKVGKVYQSKASALSAIRRAMRSKNIEPKTRFDFGTMLHINKIRVNDDEWQDKLLKLKIRIFQPSSTEDITFHLDKLK
jgi:hypothetical protein